MICEDQSNTWFRHHFVCFFIASDSESSAVRLTPVMWQACRQARAQSCFKVDLPSNEPRLNPHPDISAAQTQALMQIMVW